MIYIFTIYIWIIYNKSVISVVITYSIGIIFIFIIIQITVDMKILVNI